MEELMSRYRVFMKRFQLSEDFQAKLTIEQLRTQLGQFGITPEQMFEQMNTTLERIGADRAAALRLLSHPYDHGRTHQRPHAGLHPSLPDWLSGHGRPVPGRRSQ